MLSPKHKGRVIRRLAQWDPDWRAWTISGLSYCQNGRLSLDDLYQYGFIPCPNRDMFQNPMWSGRMVWHGNFTCVHPSYSARIVIDECNSEPLVSLLKGIQDGLSRRDPETEG